MCDDLREREPANWWRGVHEAGHAVAVWILGGSVSHIGVRSTHPEGLTPWDQVVVAHAGAIAEQLLGNDDVGGCGRDIELRQDAVEEIRVAAGDAEAERVDAAAAAQATSLLEGQTEVLLALACPIGNLIHGSAALGTNQLSRIDAAGIARGSWNGELPPELAPPESPEPRA